MSPDDLARLSAILDRHPAERDRLFRAVNAGMSGVVQGVIAELLLAESRGE
jgi:hypothetical protein